jgi:hypothetical protein
MATYELDDALVREWVTTARALGMAMDGPLADALGKQLPIETPTKLGAVVRTDRGTAVRHSLGDSEAWTVWPFHASEPDLIAHTDEIGRITKVWSEGVDVPSTDT